MMTAGPPLTLPATAPNPFGPAQAFLNLTFR